VCKPPMPWPVNPHEGKTIDWRAGCEKSARPVRRERRLKPMSRLYPYRGRHDAAPLGAALPRLHSNLMGHRGEVEPGGYQNLHQGRRIPSNFRSSLSISPSMSSSVGTTRLVLINSKFWALAVRMALSSALIRTTELRSCDAKLPARQARATAVA